MKNKDEMLYAIGSTFRQLRIKRGFRSAELFSYENDLNRTAYWRWENGENITMKNFFRLCQIHKVSPKEVFEIIEDRNYKISFFSSIVNEETPKSISERKNESE